MLPLSSGFRQDETMQHRPTAYRRLFAALLLALSAGVRSAAAADSIPIQWDPNPESEVIGYRVFIGTQPGVYDTQVDVGNATSYTFTSAQADRRYCFAVAAYSQGPTLGSKSIEVCTDTNKPPTLQAPGNQTSAVGTAVTLTLVGSDPDGLPVTYSATGLPAGLTLNSGTGFISGTPTTNGTSNVMATVSDGVLSTSQAFTWTISASLPGAATLLRPSGTIATTTPTFEWESVATATSYRLWVDDASATDPKIQLDLTPTQAGCTSTGAVCHVSPGVVLTAGRGSWSVRVSNASGPGAWSGAMDFTVADTKLPVITITTPTSATTMTTAAASLAIGGTATDDAGVTQVTWTNNRGGSGTATGTATWSVAAVPILVGTNIITVTARDAGGNSSTDVLTVTKADGDGPTLAIVSPSTATVYATGAATVTVTGNAGDDGGVTQVTWVSDRGGSGTAAGTTSWAAANIALKAGTNVIAITAHDAAGNKTTKTLTASLADSDAPTIAISNPTAAATFATGGETVALGGTASDAFGVTQVMWASDRGGSGPASGTTAWSIPAVALKPGANVITVTARDAAGNSSFDTITVTMTDGTAPVVAIAAPTAAATFTTGSATLALGGTASDAFGVTQVTWANDRGGAGSAAGTTAWSVASVSLASGVNVITVTAKDAAGHVATDVLTVTRTDGSAPTVTITAPAATSVTKSETVNLSGTAKDDTGVTDVTWTNNRGGSGRATGTTSWTIANVLLQPGVNLITVVAQDAGGNRTSASVTVTRDARAPLVAVTLPTATATFITSKAAIALGGRATDDSSVTQVTWQNSRGGSGTAAGTTEWSVPTAALLAGANVITVTARDSAGNTGTATLTVTLDARAPLVSIQVPTTASSFATSSSTISLAGAAADDAGLDQVTWSNSQGGSGTATGTSSWTVPGIALKPGLNTITVTARDVAGNTASATLSVRATDVKAPGVRITAPSADAAFSTTVGVVNLEGIGIDDFGIARVSWVNDRGGSGVAKGDTKWVAAGVALLPGVNVITVTAVDASGNASSDVARVSYERGLPSISLTSPTTAATYATSSSNVALTGVASDDSGVARVRWSTDKGQTGDAIGTTSWSIPAITVALGTTVVTVTAYDNSGNTASVTLAIVYADTSKPTVKIYTPTTAASFSTAKASVTVAGTALDNLGVTQVTWSTDRGANGTAFGTNSWSTPSIALAPGTTVITITARDAAGNTGVAVLSVTSSGADATSSTLSSPLASPTVK
jgi:hypothetical protein